MGLRSRVNFLKERCCRRYAEWTGSRSFCQRGRDSLDQLLTEYLPPKGTYIEAGALDGFNFSNTYYLDRVKGWSGLLVEPNPPQFQSCLDFRRRAIVVQCALVPFDYADKTVNLSYGADLSWVEGAYLGDEEKARREMLKRYGLSGESIMVPARTIQSLIDEFQLQVDFFSLDVEGFENSVLRGLDFARSAPAVLLVECHTTERLQEVKETLGNRYHRERKLTRHDYLFLRN
jgi:FkbM family methyltransferase